VDVVANHATARLRETCRRSKSSRALQDCHQPFNRPLRNWSRSQHRYRASYVIGDSFELNLTVVISGIARHAHLVTGQSHAPWIHDVNRTESPHALHMGMPQEYEVGIQADDSISPFVHAQVLEQVALWCGMGHAKVLPAILEPFEWWHPTEELEIITI